MFKGTAAVDETAEVLARYGTPDKRRAYAVMEATRLYREAREAAMAGYLAGGGTDESLRAPMHEKVGEPLYDAMVHAITSAAMEYGRAIEAAYEAYRAGTEAS